MLKLSFSSKLDWGSYIVFITETVSKKIEALIRSMELLSPEAARHLYKFTIQPCIEYCCHVWAGAPNCYSNMPHKLQKRVCTTVVLSFAVSLEALAHTRNVASFSFSCSISLVDLHLNWLN